MKQIKILVGNICDKKNRDKFENEINSYFELGWQITSTHQSLDPEGNKTLVLTVVMQNPLIE